MITLREIQTYDDLLDLNEEWNTLLQNSDNNCVFLTWEWMRSWWDVYGQDKRLYVLLGYDGSRLVGIAPFMVRTLRVLCMRVESLELIGSGEEVTPDQLSFITARGYKARFLRRLVGHLRARRQWDVVRLRDLREDRALIRFVSALGKNGYVASVIHNGICPYIELPAQWEEYMTSLSSASRYNISRKERSIAKAHDVVEFSLWDQGESLPRVMETLEELHRKRMLDKDMAGVSLRRSFWLFHRRVAEEFLKKGWLFMGVLRANGTIAACQYGFHYNNKVCFYQSGLDPAFSRFSVGLLSTAYMIKESIRRGCVEYDFLRGAEEYKNHWARTYRRNTEITIWNRKPRIVVPLLIFSVRRFLGTIKRRLQQSG